MATLGLSAADREAFTRFEQDVITPSMTHLVVLQFTAEWCGPCKQLSPILDKVAADYADKGVKLARIDIDKERMIADQFRIQSIPTVYALFQGQPLGDLTNYRTEGQLKQVLDQLLAQLPVGGKADEPQVDTAPLIEMGEEVLAEGDHERAISIFRQLHDLVPQDPAVIGGLVRSLAASGARDQAQAVLDDVSEETAKTPEVSRAKAVLDLGAAPAVDTSEAEARVAANPDDLDARLDLADALAAAGDRDRAADTLLEIVERDREWNDGAARKRFLQLLEAQGLEDPWGRAQRRRLSALLFT